MNIQEKIIEEYPLSCKIESKLNCYLLANKRYLIFWEKRIEKDSIEQILNQLQEKTNNPNFSKWKTLIVLGKTDDVFQQEDLFYFNNVDTYVVFYLVNEKINKIFMNDSWIFVLGCNYKKYVRKIDKIIKH